MKPNAQTIERIHKLQAYLRAEPRRLVMKTWGQNVDPEYPNHPPCGTVACLAGNAAILSGNLRRHPDSKYRPLRSSPIWDFNFAPHIAAKWLGISRDDADRLFNLGWPAKYETAYVNAETPAERVEAACQRLDYYIAEGL